MRQRERERTTKSHLKLLPLAPLLGAMYTAAGFLTDPMATVLAGASSLCCSMLAVGSWSDVMWQLTPQGSWKNKTCLSAWHWKLHFSRKENVPLYVGIHSFACPEGGKLWSSCHHLKPKEMTATDPDGSWKESLQQADAPSQILDGIQLRVYHENGLLTNFNSDLGVGVGWGGSIPELKTSGKERSGWYVRLASFWYTAPCRTLTSKRPTKRWASSAPFFPEIQRASLPE